MSIKRPITGQGYVQLSTADLSDGVTGAGSIVLENSPTLSNPTVSTIITIVGQSIGSTDLKASAAASGTITLPAATDTLVGKATTDTLTNKTLTNPKLTASSTILDSTGNASLGVTDKKGSASANYTTTSSSYADVDATNLAYTVTVPSGWKALVVASFQAATSAGQNGFFAITDGTTVLREAYTNSSAYVGFAFTYVLAGDGASHTFKLRFKTDGTNTLTIVNNTTTVIPSFEVLLMPSN